MWFSGFVTQAPRGRQNYLLWMVSTPCLVQSTAGAILQNCYGRRAVLRESEQRSLPRFPLRYSTIVGTIRRQNHMNIRNKDTA